MRGGAPLNEAGSRPSRYRAVTFDAGSTLIHWFVYTPDRFGSLCQRAGIALPRAMFREAARACARYQQRNAPPGDVGDQQRQWWRGLNLAGLRAAGVQGDLLVLADRIQAAVAALPAAWVLDPDVPAVLEALRGRGLSLAVVSNWDGDLEACLGSLGIAEYFRFIADSAVLGVRKPDPGIYRLTCAALGVPPDACLHVGDRPDTDGGVARAAGATAALYDPLGCWEGEALRVRRLMDVVDIL